MAQVHPTAVVAPKAELADDVSIGPFCYVGPGVTLGRGTCLLSHATVLGPTRMGEGNQVFPYATLGAAPQDKSHQGEPTRLEIGDRNVFREQVTVHRGTLKGSCLTRIGNDSWFLVASHVAHDCVVGDGVVLTNATALGGHVTVGDSAVCGGMVVIAPFCRIGRAAFIAGGACVERDVPPFVIAAGDRARVRALNTVGLTRLGVSPAARRALQRAFRLLYRGGIPLRVALAQLRAEPDPEPLVQELLTFLEACP
ncbi:MAG: acyl-ACP--UDP-N-acetylglucosamine O-acyltransferase [Polyangiaceae bacterium]